MKSIGKIKLTIFSPGTKNVAYRKKTISKNNKKILKRQSVLLNTIVPKSETVIIGEKQNYVSRTIFLDNAFKSNTTNRVPPSKWALQRCGISDYRKASFFKRLLAHAYDFAKELEPNLEKISLDI